MRQVLGCQNKGLYKFITDYLSFRGETPNLPGLVCNFTHEKFMIVIKLIFQMHCIMQMNLTHMKRISENSILKAQLLKKESLLCIFTLH